MAVEIPLSQGLVAVIDEADYASVLAAGKWSACVRPGHPTYALRATRRPDGGQTTIRLHNFLTGWRYVDHINGDGLDNRRSNLRQATQATNNRNQAIGVRNNSGYKGVCWHKRAGKWCAQVSVGGRRIYLGLFVDPTEAARVYDAAAREVHGEFARVNFPTAGAA
jgi:hypothetical protein